MVKGGMDAVNDCVEVGLGWEYYERVSQALAAWVIGNVSVSEWIVNTRPCTHKRIYSTVASAAVAAAATAAS